MKPQNELEMYMYCPRCASNLVADTIEGHNVKTCPKCGFIFWNNPKPVVSIILHKDKKVLMLQRANEPFKDYWVLPGGFVGYEESAEEAINREAKEEAGLDIKIDGLVGVYRIDDDPRGIHIDIIYHGRANNGVILSKEDKKWQYIFINQLPEHIAYKHRDAIIDWFTKGNQYG